MTIAAWVDRVDAGDRSLLVRWAIDREASAVARRTWMAVTQAGSAAVTIGAVLLPLLVRGWPRAVSWRAGLALAISHLAVQVVKRSVGRARPDATPLIACPDRFSFPSGHAAASLAIAATFAIAFPAFAVPLLGVGLLVGWSRVVLGVHYPGDVAAGQLLALVTVIGIQLVR